MDVVEEALACKVDKRVARAGKAFLLSFAVLLTTFSCYLSPSNGFLLRTLT